MDKEYLPGDVRDRITDLSKEFGISQNEIAKRIDLDRGSLSRFMSGQTDKLNSEHVIQIADLFGVSTDFLLGVVDNPTRINYDVTKLGLTADAAKHLYHDDVQTDVVNMLLSNEKFSQTTYLIKHYLDNTIARGYATTNTMMATLANYFEKNYGDVHNDAAKRVARDIDQLKKPIYQEDLTSIQNVFMDAVKGIKEESNSMQPEHEPFGAEMMQGILNGLEDKKDDSAGKPKLNWEDMTAIITEAVAGQMGVDRQRLQKFEEAALEVGTIFGVYEPNETDK